MFGLSDVDLKPAENKDKVRYPAVASMCHIMEDLRRETAEKTKIEMARKIILSGEMSEDKVKKMFGLSDDDLKTDEDKAS